MRTLETRRPLNAPPAVPPVTLSGLPTCAPALSAARRPETHADPGRTKTENRCSWPFDPITAPPGRCDSTTRRGQPSSLRPPPASLRI
jgi:hypothetical protein